MKINEDSGGQRGRWMALGAALLGWMFDGFEQGLFPQVGIKALEELIPGADDQTVIRWFSVITACYLVGAATGGVLFGWLGDRVGRVRAMTVSVLTYAIFSGLCGFANSAWMIAGFRILASLGMGGEWSLGVALVMEIWPDKSRALLAGLIGAAANVGYFLLAIVGITVGNSLDQIHGGLLNIGLPESYANMLATPENGGWRFLMMLGALPALLTFVIRLFVPESEKWEHEKGKGTTTNWATRDLFGVLLGSAAACGILYIWAENMSRSVRFGGTLLGLVVVTLGYLYPVVRYLQRSDPNGDTSAAAWLPTVRRMLLGACLGGVALLGTWGSLQSASAWAHQLTNPKKPAATATPATNTPPPTDTPAVPVVSSAPKPINAKAYTQLFSSMGAIVGTIFGALMANWVGRRVAYSLLCLSSLLSSYYFWQFNDQFDRGFLVSVLIAGGCTASFYGWLPLYLPELFPTRVRATGQGFSFNFGRILAVIGTLQQSVLVGMFQEGFFIFKKSGLPLACSVISSIYIVGLVIIWFAPETRGKPLPD